MVVDDSRQEALTIIEEALAVARKATPELQRLELLESVGGTLAAVDPERAFALIEEARQEFRCDIGIDDTRQPSDPRAEARRIMSRLNAAGAAHRFFADYVRGILTARDPADALAGARAAAESLSDLNVFEKWAETAARAFPERAAEFYQDAQRADWSMANTVRVLARTDTSRALDVARQIGRRWNRVVALCEVADALASQEPAAALEIVREALTEARADERDEYRPRLLRHVVWTLRRVDRDTALGVSQQLPDPGERARALTAVAHAFVRYEPGRVGQVLEEALVAAREVSEEWAGWLESRQVEDWARIDLARSLAIARAITDQAARVDALSRLLPSLVKQDAVLVREVGEELLIDGREQADLWMCGDEQRWWERAFPVLARIDPQRFLELVMQARDKDTRTALLFQFVRHVALVDMNRARSLGEGLARADDRSSAQVAMCDALAETDAVQARRQAEQISDEGQRRLAHIYIVRRITERDPHAALQYLTELEDEIVSSNTVYGVADALAECDPQIAVSLAWQMLEEHEQTHRRRDSSREAVESGRWHVLWTLTKANPAEALKLARKMRSRPLRVQMMLHVAEHLFGIDGWSEEDFTEQEPLL
jgi:CBS domain-containing protein